ncbi:MAG TPA: hypothetical protein GXZ39_01000, partial [Bacteroidales bacterium]|nr:hypothetical protein [Bacteroidales bacterium]
LKMTQAENILLSHLSEHPAISMSGFQRLAGINRWTAEKIIVNLLVVRVLEMELSEKNCLYKLRPQTAEAQKLKDGC